MTDVAENTGKSHVSWGWYQNTGVQRRFINKSQVLENRPQEVCLRLIYRQLRYSGTMNDGRWRLERERLCVVPLHIERGAFDREKRPWPILPCQSATDPPKSTQTGQLPSVYSECCDCYKEAPFPPTPLFMVAVAQQKSVQVAYLWVKSEI